MNESKLSDRERQARRLSVNTGKPWEELRPTERDELRRQAEREGHRADAFDGSSDQTNAAAYVETAMRGRMDDIALLARIAAHGLSDDDDEMEKEAEAAEALGANLEGGNPEEAAAEALDVLPLCVETTTTFEIVIGTGGPDDRLIVECDTTSESTLVGRDYTPEGSYEIRRVLYRYSWEGSGEVELRGSDRNAAEEFARRVVPELAE